MVAVKQQINIVDIGARAVGIIVRIIGIAVRTAGSLIIIYARNSYKSAVCRVNYGGISACGSIIVLNYAHVVAAVVKREILKRTPAYIAYKHTVRIKMIIGISAASLGTPSNIRLIKSRAGISAVNGQRHLVCFGCGYLVSRAVESRIEVIRRHRSAVILNAVDYPGRISYVLLNQRVRIGGSIYIRRSKEIIERKTYRRGRRARYRHDIRHTSRLECPPLMTADYRGHLLSCLNIWNGSLRSCLIDYIDTCSRICLLSIPNGGRAV